MSFLNLQASYFAIDNPRRVLARWFNRFQYCKTVRIKQREAEVKWTARAERELQQLDHDLVVEVQLYFSCVVKKRVLFHHRSTEFEVVSVSDKLDLTFQPVASAACGPEEFAASYPQDRSLAAGRAARMVPRLVEIDFRRGRWEGQFYY